MGDTPAIPAIPARQGAQASQPEPTVVKEMRNGKAVYRIDTPFIVEGRIQKPTAFYVLQRQTVNYNWDALKTGFLGKIDESVRKWPF